MSRQLAEKPEKEVIKRRTGRPLTYRRKHKVLAKDYIKNYKLHGDIIPSIAGLAAFLEKSEDAIYDWVNANIDQDFSDLVNRLRSIRHRDLLNGGLSGDMNSSIAKLCLVTKHGYTENNQADSGVTINIDRSCGQDSVTVSKGDESVTIEQDTTT